MKSRIKKNLNTIIFIFLSIASAYLVIDFEETPLYGSIMCGEGMCICMCLGSGCSCSYNADGCYCRCDNGDTMLCSTSPKEPLPPV